MKTKFDNTQQNSNYSLREEKDETISHIVSELSKLAQNWVQDQERLGWKIDSQGFVQTILILPYNQMVNAQTRIRPSKRLT